MSRRSLSTSGGYPPPPYLYFQNLAGNYLDKAGMQSTRAFVSTPWFRAR